MQFLTKNHAKIPGKCQIFQQGFPTLVSTAAKSSSTGLDDWCKHPHFLLVQQLAARAV
jgi:hypothetical protein